MARILAGLLLLSLAAAAADVSGTWILDVSLPAGAGRPTFTFRQDGERLTGRYSGAFGQADVTGTVQGDDIRFQFTVKGDLGELTARYSGKVSGDTMKGQADYGQAVGQGTFEGRRQK